MVADEIHCELVFLGHEYTPFASISEEFLMNSVTFVSPSKAFNLAGLQIANIISADANVRVRIDKAININEVCETGAIRLTLMIWSGKFQTRRSNFCCYVIRTILPEECGANKS